MKCVKEVLLECIFILTEPRHGSQKVEAEQVDNERCLHLIRDRRHKNVDL